MEIGISIFNGISFEDQARCFKRFGVRRTFIFSETPDLDSVMRLFQENGIVCETLHAPFDRINDMWSEDTAAAEAMLSRLKDSVDRCAAYAIPVTVVHLSSGCPMPEINECGIERFEALFRYAEDKGVTVALENQRYLENLSFFMERYPSVRFCWDNGHEYGFTKGIRFMELFGDRLSALHIHDNRCGDDTDDHLLPFDGGVPFDAVAKSIADSGYEGTLMLEVGKLVCVDGKRVYESLNDEQYVERAVTAAKRLVHMIEAHKK